MAACFSGPCKKEIVNATMNHVPPVIAFLSFLETSNKHLAGKNNFLASCLGLQATNMFDFFFGKPVHDAQVSKAPNDQLFVH